MLVVARDYTIAREICREYVQSNTNATGASLTMPLYACSYGLENVVFLPEYIAANPHLIPAISHTPNVANLQSSPSVEMNETALHTETLYRTPIDAVVILSLPVEWSDSLQVLVDVLRTSNGVPDKANELGADEPQHGAYTAIDASITREASLIDHVVCSRAVLCQSRSRILGST